MRTLREVWHRLNDPTLPLRVALRYWLIIFTSTIVVLLALVLIGTIVVGSQ